MIDGARKSYIFTCKKCGATVIVGVEESSRTICGSCLIDGRLEEMDC